MDPVFLAWPRTTTEGGIKRKEEKNLNVRMGVRKAAAACRATPRRDVKLRWKIETRVPHRRRRRENLRGLLLFDHILLNKEYKGIK